MGMKRLNAEQVASYRREGYLVVPDLLTTETMAALREATEAMVVVAATVGKSDSVFDFGSGASGPELRRIKSPERHNPAFASLLTSDEVLDCVADLLGEDIRFVSSKLNLKQPHGGQAVEWHQDWAFGAATNRSEEHTS